MKLKLTRKVGMILLGVWLIATGLIAVLHLNITGLGTVMAVLAIAAGVLILFDR